MPADPNSQLDRVKSALADRYIVERELGHGGMATVYLAQDLRHHRRVAVKVLRPDLAASLGSDRFTREIEVAAQLQHPNILPLFDSGASDPAGGGPEILWYAMPYVEGESLRDRLARQGELPVHEAVRLLSEVADALAHAHQAGVVHRDIKPENILLSGRHALVTDFGVAKAVSEATGRQQLTTAGVALGTPAYMAPEQAAADPHLDHRVDIYALGVLGYELLTGRPPFAGKTPQETLSAHVLQPPEPPSRYRPGISPALEEVILRCLAKRPADRFQSAEELLTALEPLATPSGGMTPTHTRPVHGVSIAPGQRRWLVAAGLAAVLLGIAVVALARRGGERPMLSLGRTTRVTSAPGIEITPAISPDGRFVAYTGGTTSDVDVFLQPTSSGGRAIAITDSLHGQQYSPDWSPDGSQLLFVSEDSTSTAIVTMLPTGGIAKVLYRTSHPAGPLAPRWSPDGSEIAFEQGDSVVVMRADGTGLRVVAGIQQPHSLSWSPDGHWLAGVRGNLPFAYAGLAFGNLAASTVFIVPAAGGTPVMISDSTTLNISPVWLWDGSGLLYVSSSGGGRDIYLQRLDGTRPEGSLHRITTGLDAQSIGLSRDGKHLAYAKYSRDVNIWMVRVPPGGVASVRDAVPITRGNQVVELMRLSPDGKWLAYDSDLNGNADIFLVASAGGTSRQITNDPADDLAPAWSPDGSEIAFHSFRTGNRDIFTMNTDGSGVTQVTSAPTQDRTPVWGADPNVLLFLQDSAEVRNVLTIRRPGKGSPWGPPIHLASAIGAPIWSADGSAVLYCRADKCWQHPVDGSPSVIRGTEGRNLFVPRPVRGTPTIFFREATGPVNSPIVAVDPVRGTVRPVVIFDDPARRSILREFATDGTRFYFTISDHQSDVWVAEVE
ncbi:MAG TPA: protein kinase [Gemmatimonadales bacterium]|nr:protein kinase [Gemmatimonadales bacterium]